MYVYNYIYIYINIYVHTCICILILFISILYKHIPHKVHLNLYIDINKHHTY